MWNLNQTGEIHSVPLEEIRMQSQVLSSSFPPPFPSDFHADFFPPQRSTAAPHYNLSR